MTKELQWYDMKKFTQQTYRIVVIKQAMFKNDQWPLLLTWFNFNPSMDK